MLYGPGGPGFRAYGRAFARTGVRATCGPYGPGLRAYERVFARTSAARGHQRAQGASGGAEGWPGAGRRGDEEKRTRVLRACTCLAHVPTSQNITRTSEFAAGLPASQ